MDELLVGAATSLYPCRATLTENLWIKKLSQRSPTFFRFIAPHLKNPEKDTLFLRKNDSQNRDL